MMTAEQLKASILQLAMQGKLVEQRPEEGTGEELYQEIQAEKKRLIKERKIKKQKPLPDILEEEIPFDIPDFWKWTRLSDISTIITGGTPSKTHPEYYGDVFPFYKPADIQNGKFLLSANEKLSEEGMKKARFIPKGAIAVNCIGSIGKSAIIPEDGTTNQQINSICFYPFSDYLYWVCQSMVFRIQISNKASMTTLPIVNKSKMEEIMIPLPPLAEQKRIVAKIEELMPFVEQYAAASTKLNTLNTTFPDMMKKSILQEAVQGKLVPQDPNDEPASVLLKKIAEEKKRLIKEGKIKKQKPLPEITEDEIPFDIPESWEWARVGNVFNLQAGKNKTSSEIGEAQTDILQYPCYGGNGKRGYVKDYNRDGDYALIGRQGALCGNINFASGKFYATEHAVVVEHFCSIDVLWSEYFLRALNLNQYATATAQPGLSVANINTVLIPIPPIAEQKRIVSKIEELMPTINEYRNSI